LWRLWPIILSSHSILSSPSLLSWPDFLSYFLSFFFCFFETRSHYDCPGWPGTCHPLTSASPVLGLQLCTTTLDSVFSSISLLSTYHSSHIYFFLLKPGWKAKISQYEMESLEASKCENLCQGNGNLAEGIHRWECSNKNSL
jgi:hypothetical protein